MPPIDEKEFEAMKEQMKGASETITSLKSELEKMKAVPPKDDKKDDKKDENDDPDLIEKQKKAREAEDKNKSSTAVIEKALGFNLGVAGFIKDHKDFLPSEVEGLVKAAETEKYDSALDRAAALKSALIQTFFGVAGNLEVLTSSQKQTLADYLKLTKTGKEQKAAEVYENLFEPALESLKRVKKAEEVGKSRQGLANPNSVHDAYKERLRKQSEKAYLGKEST